MAGYALGVDVGTTWTAAAIVRAGSEPQVVSLGGRTAAIPTVVHVLPDRSANVGDAAERRAATDADRVAREFKRRIGDTTPVLLGGQPWSPEALMATVLRWVVARVSELEGEAPEAIVVTHPANWGPLRRELLEQAVDLVGVAARFVTEPEAAAVHYASATRVPDGTLVGVYDLGGGTFDATVLRKEGTGFAMLGQPGGVERLGGLDFDAAVLAQVTGVLGTAWSGLDPADPATRAAVLRLRADCVLAKEALSEDADTSISVALPTVATEVRLTRSELEGMIRPAIEQSADAFERAVAAAGVAVEQLDRILLVGGSSRIPLVSQVLTSRFGRPLALDTHPKHAVALGAARLALTEPTPTVAVAPVTPISATTPVEPPPRPAWTEPAIAPAPGPAATAPPTRRRLPVWVPIVVLVAVIGVVASFALVLGGGDDGNDENDSAEFSRDDDAADTEPEFVAASDDTGVITVETPARWDSVGGAPVEFDDSEVVAPDLVVATAEDEFLTDLGVAGINITFFDAASIEEFGVLGDVPALVAPHIDGFGLEDVCEDEDEPSEFDLDGFDGSMRYFNGCDGTSGVAVFGGFDADDRAIIVEAHLVDEVDEADLEAILGSIDIV
jgi:actin-like ATPase involved in cell morphogenesis